MERVTSSLLLYAQRDMCARVHGVMQASHGNGRDSETRDQNLGAPTVSIAISLSI